MEPPVGLVFSLPLGEHFGGQIKSRRQPPAQTEIASNCIQWALVRLVGRQLIRRPDIRGSLRTTMPSVSTRAPSEAIDHQLTALLGLPCRASCAQGALNGGRNNLASSLLSWRPRKRRRPRRPRRHAARCSLVVGKIMILSVDCRLVFSFSPLGVAPMGPSSLHQQPAGRANSSPNSQQDARRAG